MKVKMTQRERHGMREQRAKKNKLSGYYWQFVMTKRREFGSVRFFSLQRPWVFSSLVQATQCTHTDTYFEIDLDESEVVNKAAYFRHPYQQKERESDWLVASN